MSSLYNKRLKSGRMSANRLGQKLTFALTSVIWSNLASRLRSCRRIQVIWTGYWVPSSVKSTLLRFQRVLLKRKRWAWTHLRCMNNLMRQCQNPKWLWLVSRQLFSKFCRNKRSWSKTCKTKTMNLMRTRMSQRSLMKMRFKSHQGVTSSSELLINTWQRMSVRISTITRWLKSTQTKSSKFSPSKKITSISKLNLSWKQNTFLVCIAWRFMIKINSNSSSLAIRLIKTILTLAYLTISRIYWLMSTSSTRLSKNLAGERYSNWIEIWHMLLKLLYSISYYAI